MIASKGLRPALLFFASSGVSTTASISARKLSHGTSAVIASSGSPFSDNAASRLSASKNPSCPIARSAESRPHERDSHSTKRQPIIRGAHKDFYVHNRHPVEPPEPAPMFGKTTHNTRE